MARFAPVCSLALLQELERTGDLGFYQVVPAPSVLEAAADWASLLRHRPMTSITVSPATAGRPLEPAQTAEAANIVNADAVLLPSEDGNMQLTVAMALDAAPQFGDRQLIGVVQGRTFEEYLDCAKTLAIHCNCRQFAIPASAVQRAGSRVFLARALEGPVHLLGMSTSLADDIAAARFAEGLSCSTPLRIGNEGRALSSLVRTPAGSCPPNWMEATVLLLEAVENLRLIRELIA